MIVFLHSNLPWVWLGILIICVIIEALSMSLTTIWAAIAALPFIFLSKTPLPFRWQFLFFVILTVILVIFTRPFAVKKLNVGKENRTNINALEGQEVIVIKQISNFEKGSVKAKNGVEWTAKSVDSRTIPEGTPCTVQKVEGNTLVIKKQDSV